jgi:hypothetical protein
MRGSFFFLSMPVLAFATACNAAVIQFDDLTESLVVLVDGVRVTGNGGRISNFNLVGESVSFDITTGGNNFITLTSFTNLVEPPGGDDPPGTVSDRIVLTFVLDTTTYHVAFGSDPDLPNIPAVATDLTTVPQQGLPPNPYFEDGTSRRVATVFSAPGIALDTYFVRSDAVPEPVSLMLMGVGLILGSIAHTRRGQPR